MPAAAMLHWKAADFAAGPTSLLQTRGIRPSHLQFVDSRLRFVPELVNGMDRWLAVAKLSTVAIAIVSFDLDCHTMQHPPFPLSAVCHAALHPSVLTCSLVLRRCQWLLESAGALAIFGFLGLLVAVVGRQDICRYRAAEGWPRPTKQALPHLLLGRVKGKALRLSSMASPHRRVA